MQSFKGEGESSATAKLSKGWRHWSCQKQIHSSVYLRQKSGNTFFASMHLLSQMSTLFIYSDANKTVNTQTMKLIKRISAILYLVWQLYIWKTQTKALSVFPLNYFASMNIPKILLYICSSARPAGGFMICPWLRQVWLAECQLLGVLLSVIFIVFAVVCNWALTLFLLDVHRFVCHSGELCQ